MAQPTTPSAEMDLSELKFGRVVETPNMPTPPETPALDTLTLATQEDLNVGSVPVPPVNQTTNQASISQIGRWHRKDDDFPSVAKPRSAPVAKQNKNAKTIPWGPQVTEPGPILKSRPDVNPGNAQSSRSAPAGNPTQMVAKPAIPLEPIKETKFPSITGHLKDIESRYRVDNRVRNADRSINILKNNVAKKINLIGTVKLHGAHSDLIISQYNTLTIQSRNQASLSRDNDVNSMFATLTPVTSNIVALKRRILARFMELNSKETVKANFPLLIAGEWVGPGVQKKVALNQLKRKMFVILSININGHWQPDQDYANIEDEAAGIVHVGRGGFFHEVLDVTDLPSSQERMALLTEQVEKECPFTKTFGISGIGEGIVWKAAHPLGKDPRFWLKVKGPEHRVTKTDQLAAVKESQDAVERAAEFAVAATTENRLEQGLSYFAEMQIPQDLQHIHDFKDWVINDVMKEEKPRAEERKVDMKILKKRVGWIALEWYKKRVEADRK